MILNSRRRSKALMMGSTASIVMAVVISLVISCLFATLAASAAEQAGATDPSSSSSSDSSAGTSTSMHDDRWEYDPYYIFPLIRHMPDSGLPRAGQIALYPLAFVIDLGSWPIGAMAGLAGK